MSSITPTLKLAMIQTATHWHNPQKNAAMFEEQLRGVAREVDIVVLPEMFSTGFTMDSAGVAQSMQGSTINWMRDQADRRNQVICGSVVIEEAGQFFNRFVWMTPDGEAQCYDKHHRFRMAGEHEHYSAGNERVIVEYRGWRLLLSVCYDLRFPVWLRNRQDYDVMLCVANWPAARQSAWDTLLRARAIENQAYVAGVNILGTDGNGVDYSGGTALYDAEGGCVLQAGHRAGVFEVEVAQEPLNSLRKNFPVWQDADPFHLP